MHQLEVIEIDDSLGLILPKEVLARLQVAEGDQIFITEKSDELYVTSGRAYAQDPSPA